jgi:hypothetical protein
MLYLSIISVVNKKSQAVNPTPASMYVPVGNERRK